MEQETPLGILQGKWGDHASWSFHIGHNEPTDVQVTSVKGIVFRGDSVCLTKTKRGWEIPGGHIESGESLQETLTREVFEETGILHFTKTFFGYIRVVNTIEKLNKATNEPYPSESYILLYLGETKDEPEPCSGDDCLDSAFCELSDSRVTNSADREILQLAYSMRDPIQ